MNWDNNSAERLQEVHPELKLRVTNFADALFAASFIIRITAGIRTVAQQDALYAMGRTAPGRIVTDANGTESNHVMGLAVDVAPFDDNVPDWNASHPDWQRIVALAPTYGLRDGISWRDEPHLELIEFPSEPTEEMQQVYLAGGVVEVWREFPISS